MAHRAKRRRYTKAPGVPAELQPLYQAVLEVMAGKLTVSQAARQMGWSRNHFQSMMHRGLSGLVEGLTPKPPGRSPQPHRQSELEQENQQTRQDNERLRQRVETIDRLLGVASDLLKGRQLRSRQAKKRPSPTTSITESGDDDPDVVQLLQGAKEMIALGLPTNIAAAVVGRTQATLRRWLDRQRRSLPLCSKRGRRGAKPLDPLTDQQLRLFVRQTHGLVGAESIRHSIEGVSRRQADRVKKDELLVLERERLERTTKITLAAPGIMRGSDAVHVRTSDGPCLLFATADACVPFRTSIALFKRYLGDHVAQAMERDFREHGAPLVWRCDRAKSHEVPEVLEVLKAFQVLLLHGPPRYPRFYGQLERQNREHRQWLLAMPELSLAQLDLERVRMRDVLNNQWRRATLGWRTASELWMERPTMTINRHDFKLEVDERADRIRRDLHDELSTNDLPERLAIEQVLRQRGLLSREVGGWC